MIEDYFTDQVTLYVRSVNRARQATDTATTLAARVDRTDRIVKGQNGEDSAASYLVFLSSSSTVKIGDRLLVQTLNGAASGDSTKRIVLSVNKANGFESSHIEVTC